MKPPPLAAGILRHPADGLPLPGCFLGQGPALLADKAQHVGLITATFVLEFQLLPGVFLVGPALGAGHLQFLGGGAVKVLVNAGFPLDGGGGHLQNLPIPEGGGALDGQGYRVALPAGGNWETVHLVQQQHPDRPRGQLGGGVGTYHGDMSPGEALVKGGIALALVASVQHLAGQSGTVPQHGGQPILGEGFGHILGGLDVQHGRWVVVHVVANGVEENLCLSHLGRRLHHHTLHPSVPYRVQNFPLIRRPVRTPAAPFGRGFRGQHPVFIRPLGDGHLRRRGVGLHEALKQSQRAPMFSFPPGRRRHRLHPPQGAGGRQSRRGHTRRFR